MRVLQRRMRVLERGSIIEREREKEGTDSKKEEGICNSNRGT